MWISRGLSSAGRSPMVINSMSCRHISRVSSSHFAYRFSRAMYSSTSASIQSVSESRFSRSEICRSVHEIYKGQLKLYGAMVEGAPMSEPKQPLPNDVYTTYLDKKENRQVKASALSNQRTAYVKFLKEQLC